MSIEQLMLLGFEFETLPSGRVNIFHRQPFLVNSIRSITKYHSKWFRTLEVKSLREAEIYIQTVSFID